MKIGGQDYCSVCGSLYAAVKAEGPRRQMTDLAPKSAAALHSRVKPARVLDLRETQPKPAVIVRPERSAAKVQAQAKIPAAAPKSTAHERHLAHVSDRLSQAKQIGRSAQINKFAGGPAAPMVASAPHLQAEVAPVPVVALLAGPELPRLAQTQHEAMARMAPAAVVAQNAAAEAAAKAKPKAGWRPHLALSPHRGRVAATAAAVAIMAGYVWMQNYPKLALQAASNKAGLSASLPSYLPSSYNLARTDTAPGQITLSFSSPSATQALKIAQTRTSWDSASLLDNFVTKHADGYATVQGRGLTIYLFNDNRATWVNHGTWFSIEGAARLSREQILKMAYSL